MFLYQENGKKELVTAQECVEERGGNAYLATHECLRLGRAADGAFVRREDFISSCPQVVGEERLLRTDGEARCISMIECSFGEANGILDG